MSKPTAFETPSSGCWLGYTSSRIRPIGTRYRLQTWTGIEPCSIHSRLVHLGNGLSHLPFHFITQHMSDKVPQASIRRKLLTMTHHCCILFQVLVAGTTGHIFKIFQSADQCIRIENIRRASCQLTYQNKGFVNGRHSCSLL